MKLDISGAAKNPNTAPIIPNTLKPATAPKTPPTMPVPVPKRHPITVNIIINGNLFFMLTSYLYKLIYILQLTLL